MRKLQLMLQIVVFIVMVTLTWLGVAVGQGSHGCYVKQLISAAPYVGVGGILVYIVFAILQFRQSAQKDEQLKRQDEQLADIRSMVSGYVNASSPASMDLVFPFLRYAHMLENYDGSTEKDGNENRAILESSPPVRLHFDQYSAGHLPWFDFGVVNLNQKAPMDNVIFTVTFLDDGLIVTPDGHWATDVTNQQFSFQFPSINAQSGLNGDGGITVLFPRRGKYTIRLVINARGLGSKIRDLPVIVE